MKRLIAGFLTLLMLLAFGCASKSESSSKKRDNGSDVLPGLATEAPNRPEGKTADMQNDEGDYEGEEWEDDGIGWNDENWEPIEPIIEAQYKISSCLSDFEGGRAAVSYFVGNTLYHGLIDYDGLLFYSEQRSNITNRGDIEAKVYPEGFACFYTVSRDNKKRIEPGMIIVDADGNTIFDGTVNRENDYYFVGYGEGTFLVVENVANFSENTYYLLELSWNGEEVHRMEVNGNSNWGVHLLEYCGESIFSGDLFGDNVVYDADTHKLISISYPLCTEFVDGFSVACSEKLMIWGYRHVFFVALNDIKASENKGVLELDDNKARNAELDPIQISDGLVIFPKEKVICDYRGKQIATLPEEWDIVDIDGFSGGYAAVKLKGADGRNYISVMDTNGQLQYDPIRVESWDNPVGNFGKDASGSWNGYVCVRIDGKERVYSPKGKHVALKDVGQGSTTFHVGRYWYSEGWRRSGDYNGNCYIDMDQNILNKVCVCSNIDAFKGYC